MGRWCYGDIEHKLWFGLQPSDAANRYCSQPVDTSDCDDSDIYYKFTGITYGRVRVSTNKFYALQLHSDITKVYKLIKTIQQLSKPKNIDNLVKFLRICKFNVLPEDKEIYREEFISFIKDNFGYNSKYFGKENNSIIPLKDPSNSRSLKLMYGFETEEDAVNFIDRSCDLLDILTTFKDYLSRVDSNWYLKIRESKLIPAALLDLLSKDEKMIKAKSFGDYDCIDQNSLYGLNLNLANIDLGLKIFLHLQEEETCSFDAGI